MANHKRRRPKSRRAGCLLCKPHKLTTNKKANRVRDNRAALRRELTVDQEPLWSAPNDAPS